MILLFSAGIVEYLVICTWLTPDPQTCCTQIQQGCMLAEALCHFQQVIMQSLALNMTMSHSISPGQKSSKLSFFAKFEELSEIILIAIVDVDSPQNYHKLSIANKSACMLKTTKSSSDPPPQKSYFSKSVKWQH